MSLTPFFYLEKWNDEKKCYEEIKLYKNLSKWAGEKDKARGFEEIDFWPWNGTHEIFSMLGTASKDYTHDAINGIHSGEPPMVSSTIKERIDIFFQNGDLNYPPTIIKWITLADLYIEKLKNPKVLDYDEEWEDLDHKIYKDNPINGLISRIETWVELGDSDWSLDDDKSLIRIVYWVI